MILETQRPIWTPTDGQGRSPELGRNPFATVSHFVSYHFFDPPLSESSVPIERALLESIRRNNTGLLLYRTKGIYRGEFFTPQKHPIYRLQSPTHHATIDFYFDHYERGLICNVVILFIQPEYQRGFYALKKFALGQVAKTLFELQMSNGNQVAAIIGDARPNQRQVRVKPTKSGDWRHQRTKDGTPKLVRMYEKLGLLKDSPNSNVVVLKRPPNHEHCQ